MSDPLLVSLCLVAGALAGVLWPSLIPTFAARSSEALEQPAWTLRVTSRPALGALGALACALTGLELGATLALVPGLVLCVILVGVTAIDLRYRIIPNRIVGAGTILGFVLTAAADPSRAVELVLAALLAVVVLTIAAIASPGGLGMGDVKLAGMLGAFLGRYVVVGIASGLCLAFLPSLALLARHGLRGGRSMTLALGPFLALGGLVALVAGPDVLHWYLNR